MMRGSAFGGLLAVIMAFGAVGAQQVHPPIEAFGQLPAIQSPALAPDGKHLAFLKPVAGRMAVLIVDLVRTDVPTITIPLEDDGYIVDIRWANAERLLITINVNRGIRGEDVKPWYRTTSVDTQGLHQVMLFKDLPARDHNYSASYVADLAPDDPDHIYMTLWFDFGSLNYSTRSDIRNAIFKVDVNTGKATPTVSGTIDTSDFVMDGHGTVVARIDTIENPLTDVLYLYRDGNWQESGRFDAQGGRGTGIDGLSRDGDALVRLAVDGATGRVEMESMALKDQAEKTLLRDDRYDVDAALHDPWTERVIGGTIIADLAKDVYFDPDLQAMQARLEASSHGNSVHIASWDRAMQSVVLAVEGPRLPATYYLFDRATFKGKIIAFSYPGLSPGALGDKRTYPYKARDGLDIPAYLTLPPGKAAQNLPTVIMPHGGPMARDQMDFDWMAQFFANRGYAVLQPNFRGSSGYGKTFEEAGYGQWGLKMQDDITDGVQKLIADGIADPKRICIVGGSYGGYAALAGAAFTPDLYACAVSWAGVTDLRRFLATRATDYGRDSRTISSWSRYIGDREHDAAKLDAASPAMNAAKIKCPVLLMHGSADATVRIDQSEIMEDALKRAGKSVRFVAVKGETHYLQAESSRILFLREVEAFLAAHIGT